MRHNRKIKEPIVAITKGMTEGQSLEKALDMLPIDEIIKKGDKVVITPNGVKDKKPKDGVVSGPKTLKKLIEYIKKREPSEIYIAFGSGGTDSQKVLKSATPFWNAPLIVMHSCRKFNRKMVFFAEKFCIHRFYPGYGCGFSYL